jgi:ankyrin repeat protein
MNRIQCFWLLTFIFIMTFRLVAPQAPPHFNNNVVTTYREMNTNIPIGNTGDTGSLSVYIPVKPGNNQIADPATLFQHVKGVWDAVIEENQAGLVDAKQMSIQQPPITKEEAWHHYNAGKKGIIDSARFLLAFSVIPSLQSGGSALHTAASHNQVELIQLLLDDPNTAFNVNEVKLADGTTPLFNSVSLGHIEATTVLLKRSANPNHVSKNGIVPIHIAASMGHVAIVQILLDYGADPNYQQSFAATTALHFASEMGRANVIELLCKRGANKHSRKTTGGTALHTASDTNQTAAVVALLTKCNSDPNLLLNGDTTPLYLAAQRGFTSVIQALVEHGANINYIMPKGKFHGSLMTIGESSDYKQQMYKSKNTEIGNGATALHACVENGHLDATIAMLKLGAKQLTSMQGASPLLISLQYKHPKIARVLLRGKKEDFKKILQNAHVNVQAPQDGIFPLFVAAGAGYVNIVKRLIKLGANLTLKTKQGVSALDYAKYRRKHAVVKLLVKQKWKDKEQNKQRKRRKRR